MLRPSIFGESLFDDWMDDFPFGKEFEKAMFPAKDPLYGKHAKNMMKTDIRETDEGYEVIMDLRIRSGCLPCLISWRNWINRAVIPAKRSKYLRSILR